MVAGQNLHPLHQHMADLAVDAAFYMHFFDFDFIYGICLNNSIRKTVPQDRN